MNLLLVTALIEQLKSWECQSHLGSPLVTDTGNSATQTEFTATFIYAIDMSNLT